MKLAVVNLTGGGLSGGYRKYLQTMLPLLKADPRLRRLEVFMPPGARWPELGVEVSEWRRADARLGFRGLKRRLREMAPDVVFIPTARWLYCRDVPVVVMVRNMEPLRVPCKGNPAMTKVRNLARAYAAWAACRRAAGVIAVSGHVRDHLLGSWRLSPERVGVVPHGVGPRLGRRETVRPRALGAAEGPFLFTAGSIRPARGLRDLLVASARIQERGFQHRIVIGGAPDPDSTSYSVGLRQFAVKLGVADLVCWAGQLTPAEMAWCFTNSAAFVMTSWAEACPNTALEALSYGCLSVSTDQPPMPELFGGSAYYYRARDGASLAESLLQALGAPEAERLARRAAAEGRAKCYDWKVTAERTLEELEKAVARGTRR